MKKSIKLAIITLFMLALMSEVYAEVRHDTGNDLIPIRLLFELNDYQVLWENESKRVLIADKDNIIKCIFSRYTNSSDNSLEMEYILFDEVAHVSMKGLKDHGFDRYLRIENMLISAYPEVDNGTNVGSIAPNFIFAINREIMDLHSFGDKEKNTILLFWASWCPQCSSSMELLNLKGVDESKTKIIGISIDDCKQNDGNIINLYDFSREVFHSYNVEYVPTAYVISGENRVIDIKVGGREVYNLLDS